MYGCVFLWVMEGVWETKGNGRRCHGVVGAVVGLRPFPWRGNIKY